MALKLCFGCKFLVTRPVRGNTFYYCGRKRSGPLIGSTRESGEIKPPRELYDGCWSRLPPTHEERKKALEAAGYAGEG